MHWGITNNRPEHAMFSGLTSNSPVRSGSLTNTQGLLQDQLSILASQNPARMSVFVIHLNPIFGGDDEALIFPRVCRLYRH